MNYSFSFIKISNYVNLGKFVKIKSKHHSFDLMSTYEAMSSPAIVAILHNNFMYISLK